MEDQRLSALTKWLKQTHIQHASVKPLAGDASFRRYFRVETDGPSYIAMDAPPLRETVETFVNTANTWRALELNTPVIHAHNLQDGFLLLSDFGDRDLNQALNDTNVDQWYERCFDILIQLQKQTPKLKHTVQAYNNKLYSFYEESSWFITWYLQQHHQIKLKHTELAELEREIHLLCGAMLEQPQVITHRDFHSRNLMVVDEATLGILDFQDNVLGPITFDLVSLLRDCYIDWPIDKVHQWVEQYRQKLIANDMLKDCSAEQFLRWFDWAGVQRHLKCIGLFVRLNLRDGKLGFLQYIPRLQQYIQQVSASYPELSLIAELISRTRATPQKAEQAHA